MPCLGYRTVSVKLVMACIYFSAGSLEAAFRRGDACCARFIHPVHQSTKLGLEVLEPSKSGHSSSLTETILKILGRCGLPCNLVNLGIELECLEDGWEDTCEQRTSVSFNDHLCLVVCREEGWTCVTNDGALRRLCERHGVETRFGLGLMVDLVAAGALTRRRAMAVARRMQASNLLHINNRVLTRLLDALDSRVR